MKKEIRKIAATGMAVLAMTVSAMPAFADVNVYSGSTVNISGSSEIGEAIIDRSSEITVDGENASVVQADEVNVVNSYIDTLIDSGTTTIRVRGKNIDITNLDATNIYDSMIVTVLKQKATLIKAQELVKNRKG